MIKFSIITTSLLNIKYVDKFFKSLSIQKFNNFELVFIDQYNYNQKQKLKKYNIKNITYIKIKKSSLSSARNIGLNHAKGEYLLFIDDDCFFDNLFLQKINNKLKKNIHLLGFKIMNRNENIIVKKFNKKQFRHNYEIIRHLCSSNFVIKKNKLKFDQLLGVGSKGLAQSGEDTDYLLNNFKNKKFFYDEKISIFHPKPSNNKNYKKIFLYSIGQSVVLFKNKHYFIFLISIIKNFFTMIFCPKLSNLIYFLGKLLGILYYFLTWTKIKANYLEHIK
jgi:glycosyltransferase involved in cell wall biosynthesis